MERKRIFLNNNLYLQIYAHVGQANTYKKQTQYNKITNKLGAFDRHRPHFRNSNDCFIKS